MNKSNASTFWFILTLFLILASPYGHVNRKRWTESEKRIIYTEFGEHMRRRTLPSLKTIQNVIKDNPELRNRTSPQVKTWISNQFKNNK